MTIDTSLVTSTSKTHRRCSQRVTGQASLLKTPHKYSTPKTCPESLAPRHPQKQVPRNDNPKNGAKQHPQRHPIEDASPHETRGMCTCSAAASAAAGSPQLPLSRGQAVVQALNTLLATTQQAHRGPSSPSSHSQSSAGHAHRCLFNYGRVRDGQWQLRERSALPLLAWLPMLERWQRAGALRLRLVRGLLCCCDVHQVASATGPGADRPPAMRARRYFLH